MQAQHRHQILSRVIGHWQQLAAEKQAAILDANQLCKDRQKNLLVSHPPAAEICMVMDTVQIRCLMQFVL